MKCTEVLRRLNSKPSRVNRYFSKFSCLVLLLCSSPILIVGSIDPHKKELKFTHTADANLIQVSVDSLCNDSVYRTWNNTKELTRARNYVFSALSEFSKRTEKQIFSDKKNEKFNVISSFGPEDAPRLIIGAHYDVCGQQQGADGNASGVSSLIELARLLKLNQIELSYNRHSGLYFGRTSFFQRFHDGKCSSRSFFKKGQCRCYGHDLIRNDRFLFRRKGFSSLSREYYEGCLPK